MTAADIEGRAALNDDAELRTGGSGSRSIWNVLERWRYRFVPDRLIGEILTKRWIDSAIPFTVLVVVLGVGVHHRITVPDPMPKELWRVILLQVQKCALPFQHTARKRFS